MNLEILRAYDSRSAYETGFELLGKVVAGVLRSSVRVCVKRRRELRIWSSRAWDSARRERMREWLF